MRWPTAITRVMRACRCRCLPIDWKSGTLASCHRALTIAQLRRPHASVPRNPLIADLLFLAGYVEKAATGILDMIARCRAAGLRTPEFRQDGGGFIQVLRRPEAVVTPQVDDVSKTFNDRELQELTSLLGVATPQVATQLVRILQAVQTEPISRGELQRAAGLSDREHFRQAYLEPLLRRAGSSEQFRRSRAAGCRSTGWVSRRGRG
jgi:ATP-dependent DNA helicase RecG